MPVQRKKGRPPGYNPMAFGSDPSQEPMSLAEVEQQRSDVIALIAARYPEMREEDAALLAKSLAGKKREAITDEHLEDMLGRLQLSEGKIAPAIAADSAAALDGHSAGKTRVSLDSVALVDEEDEFDDGKSQDSHPLPEGQQSDFRHRLPPASQDARYYRPASQAAHPSQSPATWSAGPDVMSYAD